jgi:hypothetical protein
LWDEAAHSIADIIDDYSAGGVGSTVRGEDSTAANSQEAKIATITTTTAATTTDTTAPVRAKSRNSISTTPTLVGDTITTVSSSISSSCIVKEQSQNAHIQKQPPPPENADDHHHSRHHPHPLPHHSQHEDHHGESSVTQHTDITDRTLFYSGIASHIVATVVLLFMGRFVSVMAPPANITLLRDHFIHERGKGFAKAAKKFFSNPQ